MSPLLGETIITGMFSLEKDKGRSCYYTQLSAGRGQKMETDFYLRCTVRGDVTDTM